MAPKYSAEWWEKVAALSAQKTQPNEPATCGGGRKGSSAIHELTHAEPKKVARSIEPART